jgi:hypothetical protein
MLYVHTLFRGQCIARVLSFKAVIFLDTQTYVLSSLYWFILTALHVYSGYVSLYLCSFKQWTFYEHGMA